MKRAAIIIIFLLAAVIAAGYVWVEPDLALIDRRVDVASKRTYSIDLEHAVTAADFPDVVEKPSFMQGMTLARRLAAPSLKSMATAIAVGVKHDFRSILRAHLESVYLGRSGPRVIIGVEDGATIIFGKPAERLELHESALLAGMMRSPAEYDPNSHRERALQRRNEVLAKMLELRMITVDEHRKAVRAPLR
jgi:hypothetical protein